MHAEISKEFSFSASHQLHGLPEDHQCSRLHGHNYKVIVSIAGSIKEPGFVIDYAELDFFKKWIDQVLDHRHLNDVMDINPTAENLAEWMVSIVCEQLNDLGHNNILAVSVTVSETPKTRATVMYTVESSVQEEYSARTE